MLVSPVFIQYNLPRVDACLVVEHYPHNMVEGRCSQEAPSQAFETIDH